MKNISTLLVFGLLMQYEIAQASWMDWVYNELFGMKQSEIVHDVAQGEFFDYKKRASSPIVISEKDSKKLAKNYKIFTENIARGIIHEKSQNVLKTLAQKRNIINQKHEEQFVAYQYEKLRTGASYVKSRRDFIAPFASFGFPCLKLQSNNDVETMYNEQKCLSQNALLQYYHNNRYTDFVTHTKACENAIWQFDLEQRVYQNRVVAAGVLLGAASIAGYFWAQKK